MQYEKENEKYVVTNVPDIPVSQQLQVTKDPEIRRARTVLLYMIHGLMHWCIVNIIYSIYKSVVFYKTLNPSTGLHIGECLILFFVYGFGFSATFQYSVTGLRVFATTNIPIIIVFAVEIIMVLVKGASILHCEISAGNVEHQAINKSLLTFTIVVKILAIVTFIFLVMVSRLSSKLARLIANKKDPPVQNI